MVLVCAVNNMVIKTASESDIKYLCFVFSHTITSIHTVESCLLEATSKQLKALTNFTQNCIDFPKKIVVKTVAHIFRTVEKIVAVVKKSCSVHGR